jgi:hypothetical protein
VSQKWLFEKTGRARTLVFAGPWRLDYLPDASFGAAAPPGASVQDSRHGFKRVATLCSRDAAKRGVFALFERAGEPIFHKAVESRAKAPFGLRRLGAALDFQAAGRTGDCFLERDLRSRVRRANMICSPVMLLEPRRRRPRVGGAPT